MSYQHSEILNQNGLTEELLNFYHSRTANADWTITMVQIVDYWWLKIIPKSGDSLVLEVYLEMNGLEKKVEYTINPAKVRQKRLNIILGNK